MRPRPQPPVVSMVSYGAELRKHPCQIQHCSPGSGSCRWQVDAIPVTVEFPGPPTEWPAPPLDHRQTGLKSPDQMIKTRGLFPVIRSANAVQRCVSGRGIVRKVSFEEAFHRQGTI
jgi:hypothetical protein